MMRYKFTEAGWIVTVEAYELPALGWPYRLGFQKHDGVSVMDYSTASSLPSARAYVTAEAGLMAGVCAALEMVARHV
jgi:hypothetical protein